MKKLFLAILSICALSFVSAQNSWKIQLNDSSLLTTGKEDEKANVRKIHLADWEKNGVLEVKYYDATGDKDLRRSIIFADEKDNELIRKDDISRVKIPAKELKRLFAGKEKIKIFTSAVPADPELAARVRARRVHLCTLELK